jgi:hypothetical protein
MGSCDPEESEEQAIAANKRVPVEERNIRIDADSEDFAAILAQLSLESVGRDIWTWIYTPAEREFVIAGSVFKDQFNESNEGNVRMLRTLKHIVQIAKEIADRIDD